MCIILSCDKNTRPDAKVLRTCWENNPDGAGVMYASGGVVHGHKGLMTLDDLLEAVAEVPDGVPLVIHFRIGTSGGLSAGVTHPYPVSESIADLHATEWSSPIGIAHNGVLSGQRIDNAAGVSDTVAYIRDFVAPLACRKDGNLVCAKAKRRLKETSKGSRLCIMEGDGRVMLTGSGWNPVCPGINASNTSWKAIRWSRYTYKPSTKKPVSYASPVYSYPSYSYAKHGVPSYPEPMNSLPPICKSCPMAETCSEDVPECFEVAEYCGYTIADWDMAFGTGNTVALY